MKKINYTSIANQVIKTEIEALKKLKKSFGKSFSAAVNLISKIGSGKLVLCGIGKSGLISRKGSATLSSVGIASFFLHPSEAAHGDLGQISKKDILLILSYSGETQELKNIIQYCNRFSIPIIGCASKESSLLLRASDIKIILPKVKEAGIGSLAPTSSTTMQCAFLDSLAVALSYKKKFNKLDFKRLHPAGNLGKMLTTVEDLMITGSNIPLINENKKMNYAIKLMSQKKLGCLIIVNRKKNISGFISDGDLRRKSKKDILNLEVKKVMTKNPKIIEKTTLAAKALKIMNKNKITSLIVSKKNSKKFKKAIGIVHLHSILEVGIL